MPCCLIDTLLITMPCRLMMPLFSAAAADTLIAAIRFRCFSRHDIGNNARYAVSLCRCRYAFFIFRWPRRHVFAIFFDMLDAATTSMFTLPHATLRYAATSLFCRYYYIAASMMSLRYYSYFATYAARCCCLPVCYVRPRYLSLFFFERHATLLFSLSPSPPYARHAVFSFMLRRLFSLLITPPQYVTTTRAMLSAMPLLMLMLMPLRHAAHAD